VPTDPPEQRAIAHILGTLDDKIELNRRMNETLEAMARAIFKSWFIDETENGIPKGWRVARFGELIELAYGRALKEEDRRPGNVPVFGSNGQVGWHDEKLVAGPGIVVGRKGNPGIVTWVPTDFFAIDTTFYVIPKSGCRSLFFLFHALRTHDLASLGADSAVPGLNRNLAYMNEQVVPPVTALDAFDKQIGPLFARIHHNAEESCTLAAIRDALLPKLLSGGIRVKSAEKFIGRAV
jgi:type I restriction enzyme S subunit